MANTRGVFTLRKILEEKLPLDEWVPLEDVWLEPPFPGTGYFGGGIAPFPNGRYSTMDKVTYSTDTTVAVPGAALSAARVYLAATGNSDAGYFGGGDPSSFTTAQMDKVTYASDTTVAVPGANLTVARFGVAATGNSTSGYFGGGYAFPSGGPVGANSIMDKVTYASDTTAAVPGANLTAARSSLAASSSRANGLSQPPTPSPTPSTTGGIPNIV